MEANYVYTIYDKISEIHGPLFEARNDAVAVRNFRNLTKAVSEVEKTDYVLKCIGRFNREREGQFEVMSEKIINIPVITREEVVRDSVAQSFQKKVNRDRL